MVSPIPSNSKEPIPAADSNEPHPFGTRFGHTPVQRVFTPLGRQPIGIHHCFCIRRSNGNHNIVEIIFFQQGHMPHRAFHQCFRRRCAVFFQQFFFPANRCLPQCGWEYFWICTLSLPPEHGFYYPQCCPDRSAYSVDSRRHTFQCQPVIEMEYPPPRGSGSRLLMASTRRTASISGIATRTISHPAFSKS